MLWSIEPGLDRQATASCCRRLASTCSRMRSVIPARHDNPPDAVTPAGSVCFQVVDNGPGVAEGRSGENCSKRLRGLKRSRNTAGYGLGLNLVARWPSCTAGGCLLRNADARTLGDHRASGAGGQTIPSTRNSKDETRMTDREQLQRGAEQSPGGHARLLDHQDSRDNAGRNRRRHGHHDLARRNHAHPVPTAISSVPRYSGCCWSAWSWRRSGRASSTRGFTGRRSSLRRPAARRSPTSPTARSGSAIPAARCCCSPASCVAVRLAPVARHGRRQHASRRPGRKPSTGSRSPSRRRSAPRSATGSPTRGLGYSGGALVFGAGLAVLAVLYFATEHQPRGPVLGGLHPDPAAWARRSAISSTSRSPRAVWNSAGRSRP